ncbi:MAG: N-acetyltransferase family protein [Dehalococcoidia bacterium]
MGHRGGSDDERRAWFDEHAADPSSPVVVADADGTVAGFAYLSIYRGKAGYRFTRETSVYVDPAFHRRGVGRALMEAHGDCAHLGVHALMASPSRRRTRPASPSTPRLASVIIARKVEVGRKFGRWLDSVEMELLLPVQPSD